MHGEGGSGRTDIRSGAAEQRARWWEREKRGEGANHFFYLFSTPAMAETAPPPRTRTCTEETAPPPRARTCTGCTYYSRQLHAQGREPVCVGLRGTRTVDTPVEEVPLPPDVAAGGPFASLCVGFGVWPDAPPRPQALPSDDAQTQTLPGADEPGLPQCLGIQIVRAQAVASSPALAGAGVPEAGAAEAARPPRRTSPPRTGALPGDTTLDTLLGRWERSAAKVATRMAENVAFIFGGGGGRE